MLPIPCALTGAPGIVRSLLGYGVYEAMKTDCASVRHRCAIGQALLVAGVVALGSVSCGAQQAVYSQPALRPEAALQAALGCVVPQGWIYLEASAPFDAASLAERGVSRLALYDVTPGRAADAARRLGAEFGIGVTSADTSDPAGFDLVVNSTPLGLQAGDPLPFDAARLSASATVVDILMKNQPTPLLRACRERGIVAHPGFEMLLQQMPEYLDFFGYAALAQSVRTEASELRALLADGL